MAKMQYKRKNYIIDKTFQFRFIATFLLLVVIALLVFTVVVMGYYYVRNMMGDNVFKEFITVHKSVKVYDETGKPVIDPGSGEIKTVSKTMPPENPFIYIMPPILINNLIIMIIICIIGIFYSHRIAGPVYRIEQDIKNFLDGKRETVIKLRKTDKLQSLARSVNMLFDELRKK